MAYKNIIQQFAPLQFLKLFSNIDLVANDIIKFTPTCESLTILIMIYDDYSTSFNLIFDTSKFN